MQHIKYSILFIHLKAFLNILLYRKFQIPAHALHLQSGRQRGCGPVSRCSQVRPRNTAADGPSLATCEVQAVRAHAPLPYWSGAAIFDRAGSACR